MFRKIFILILFCFVATPVVRAQSAYEAYSDSLQTLYRQEFPERLSNMADELARYSEWRKRHTMPTIADVVTVERVKVTDQKRAEARKAYAEGTLDAELLEQAGNILRTMPDRALLYVSWPDLYTACLALQEGMERGEVVKPGIRRDVVVVSHEFFQGGQYTDEMLATLGVDRQLIADELDAIRFAGADGADRVTFVNAYELSYRLYALLKVAKQSRRTFYSDYNGVFNVQANELVRCFYNEGLVIRYSETPYDNISVMKHNALEAYRLQFLLSPDAQPDHEPAEGQQEMENMCATMFRGLLPYMKDEGDDEAFAACVEYLRALLDYRLHHWAPDFREQYRRDAEAEIRKLQSSPSTSSPE